MRSTHASFSPRAREQLISPPCPHLSVGKPSGLSPSVLHTLLCLTLGARVGLLSQQTVSKSQVNGKQTQPITYLASLKQIYNLLNQFLCNLLSSVSAWFVCSLLGHVTTVSPSGKPWKNWQFIKQIYLQFTEPFVQSVFFQFAEWFNHSLLDSVNQKKTKLVYWRCPWLVNLKNTWNFYRTCHWW